ncbi:MAG: ABC transporter permease [Nitrososphaerota archaeon]|nr:ABC transporter permease [Nitrososphaerota archaeon]
MLGKTWILVVREIRSWAKSPFFALTFLVNPIIYLFVFGSAFNAAFFQTGGGANILQGAPDYFNYVATGIFVSMPMTFATRTGTSIFADRLKGYLERLVVAPISRETILLSKIFAGILLGLLQATAILAMTLPLGLESSGLTLTSVIVLVVAVSMLSYGFSSFFVIVSIRIRRWATQQLVISIISSPIVFLSDVFYPISRIPTLIRWVALVNPLTYATDITRQLFFHANSSVSGGVLFDLSVLFVFVIATTIALMVTSRLWLILD